MTNAGVGARVPRKEDDRFLHGRGNYVSGMILPGQQEVAFLRSPVAHARIVSIDKPAGKHGANVFVCADLKEAAPIIATSGIGNFKVVPQYALALDRVRHVGEMIAMAVAPTRAEAEDLIEEIQVEYDELPVVVDARSAKRESKIALHDEMPDNVFVTLTYENGFHEKSRGAPIIVKREIALARQAMVPLEGKAIVAHWDERADQLVVYCSNQAPHLLRIGLAKFLGLDQN